MFIQKKRNGRRVVASEEAGAGEVFVEPEATDLLFETEDVADVIAEVTGEDVTVEADPETDAVTFDVGGEQFEVTPDGTEEVLESRKVHGRRVAANRRTAIRRAPRSDVKASAATRRTSAVRANRRLGRRTISR